MHLGWMVFGWRETIDREYLDVVFKFYCGKCAVKTIAKLEIMNIILLVILNNL
jgi:hypothetical protein